MKPSLLCMLACTEKHANGAAMKMLTKAGNMVSEEKRGHDQQAEQLPNKENAY